MGIPMMDMDWCDFTSSDSYLQKKSCVIAQTFLIAQTGPPANHLTGSGVAAAGW